MKRFLAAALAAFFVTPLAFAQQTPTNLPGCQYLASVGTLADKQTAILNCTQGKLLKVEATPAAGVNQDVNITAVGGNVVTTTVPVAGTGTAGTANAGVATVQGIASMVPVQVTVAPVATAAAGIATVKSSALESNHVIKNSAGNLHNWAVTTGAVQGWVLLYNGATAPTAGGAAVAPEKCFYAPANSSIAGGSGGAPPQYFSTGIVVVFSSSGCLTNTASTTVFISGDAS